MSSSTRGLTANAFANVLQTLIGTALLFALYRLINESLGVSQLGIWSVVLASVAISHLTDLGLTAGITRFVARDLGRGKPARAAMVIDTAMITMAAVVMALAIPLYFFGFFLLQFFFKGSDLVLARLILPYALASLWFTMLGTAVQGAFDGCQRMDIRALLVLSGQALFLLFSIWLIPAHGILGLAWAQLIQGIILVIAGRAALHRILPSVHVFPRKWHLDTLREMLSYGLNVQASTVLILLFDPVTKALMAKFGGASAAGHFEMANQVALKVRALIISANQVIIPYVASDQPQTQNNELYKKNVEIIYSIALPMFSMLTIWSPFIAWALLGTIDHTFILLVALLSLAWCLNVFNAPAYFFNMGTGAVGWNTLCHLIMGFTNLVAGYILGFYLGADGVVLAYIIAIIAGCVFLVISFQIINTITATIPSFRELSLVLCPLIAGTALFFILHTLSAWLTIFVVLASSAAILLLAWHDRNIHEFISKKYISLRSKESGS